MSARTTLCTHGWPAVGSYGVFTYGSCKAFRELRTSLLAITLHRSQLPLTTHRMASGRVLWIILVWVIRKTPSQPGVWRVLMEPEESVPSAVQRTGHTPDSKGQVLDLAFRFKSLPTFQVVPDDSRSGILVDYPPRPLMA